MYIRSGVDAERLRRGTATVTMGDAGCTRTLSFVAVSILGAAPCVSQIGTFAVISL